MVIADVSKILWEDVWDVRVGLEPRLQPLRLLLTLPYLVVHTRGDESVSCLRGEVTTGYTQRVSMQLADGLGGGLLETSAVIHTHCPADTTHTWPQSDMKNPVDYEVMIVVPALCHCKVLLLYRVDADTTQSLGVDGVEGFMRVSAHK